MRTLSTLMFALLPWFVLAHDIDYPHFDHYLDHEEASDVGFDVSYKFIEWTDRNGQVYNGFEFVVIHPGVIQNRPLQGAFNLPDCGVLSDTSSFVNSEDESEITTLIAIPECAALSQAVSVYYELGKEWHFYFIKAEAKVGT